MELDLICFVEYKRAIGKRKFIENIFKLNFYQSRINFIKIIA
jgi:hypothetical protein